MINNKKIFGISLLCIVLVGGFAFVSADEISGNLDTSIDQGLNVSLPCNPTSVSNGSVNPNTCVITCNTNYTLNGVSCVANQGGGGGGGGGGSSRQDPTPTTTGTNTTVDNSTGSVGSNGNQNGGDTNQGSIQGSTYTPEFNNAYLYAYSIGITTMGTIQEADLDGNLIRSHMAKMMVNYAIKVLQRAPDTTKLCQFSDIADQSAELQGYIVLACQLGIMGIHADGTPMTKFDPNATVTRAQFGTVLSRVLYGDQYNTPGNLYYTNHLTALQLNGIITNTNPTLQELRGYVMLMLMRATQ